MSSLHGFQYTTVAAVVAAFLLAAVLVRVAHALIHRLLDRLDIVSAENRAAVHARGEQLIRALTLLAYGVAALASISFALERFGVGEPRWSSRDVAHWVVVHGINVAIIVIGAFIVVRAANLAIVHLEHKLGRRHAQTDLEWQRRAATLAGILGSLVTVSVGFIAVLMLLRELTIDVVPILTGAGIAGLAIGFGAQNLVRDVISGFFLILEDQVRVGDLARINGVGGTVEQVNLRTIVLRDGDGAVQVFPNGTITALANLSKQYSYAIVDVRAAYAENLDRVVGTLRDVGESMQHDAVWGALVVGPLQIAAVESIDGGAVTIRVKFKTLPLNQGRVANELRRRIVPTFVGRGIKPYA
jgi:moderate conductance mechanosensitive channel